MNFWKTLFNSDDLTCFSFDLRDVKLRYADCYSGESFFSINPMYSHRADSNVTVFRNILCEFDKDLIEVQLANIKCSEVPYTSLVFSGNKSIHMIISLEEPCKTREEYDELVKRIYRKLPDVDKSCSNPSRFSRAPGAFRNDTGKEQTLIELKQRVPRAELERWLPPKLVTPPAPTRLLGARLMPIWCRAFVEYGSAKGGRNRMLFAVACELFRQGFTEEEIITMQTVDLSPREIRQTVMSARRTIENNT